MAKDRKQRTTVVPPGGTANLRRMAPNAKPRLEGDDLLGWGRMGADMQRMMNDVRTTTQMLVRKYGHNPQTHTLDDDGYIVTIAEMQAAVQREQQEMAAQARQSDSSSQDASQDVETTEGVSD